MLSKGVSLSKSGNELSQCLRKQAGWVPLLGKYINISNGVVTDSVPIDIRSYQEELVRKFSTFSIGVEDILQYFICIRKGEITSNCNNEDSSDLLIDLVKELVRPQYYRECVDCVFFQQKCEKMKSLLKKDSKQRWDTQEFRQFLEFLSEKRKSYLDVNQQKQDVKLQDIIEKAANIKKEMELESQITSERENFLNECSKIVIIEDNSTNNPYEKSKILFKVDANKNISMGNMITISKDKNRVSLLFEIMQKLNLFETYKLEIVPPISNQQIFQFVFQSKQFKIYGKQLNQKQKAKESCCEEVIEEITQYINAKNNKDNQPNTNISQNDEIIESKKENIFSLKSQFKDTLLFNADDVQLAPLRVIENKKGDLNMKKFNEQKCNKIDQSKEQLIISKSEKQTQQQQLQKQPVSTASNALINSEQESTGNEYQQIIKQLKVLQDQLGLISKLELNPFTIFKIGFEQFDQTTIQRQIKIFNKQLEDILNIAAKLYEYDDIMQSPCVLVQEDGHTFFLRTIIMKKLQKGKPLIGRIRSSNQEQSYICSAIELIYKIAFKHQSHEGEVKNLSQVILELITEAEYKSQCLIQEQLEVQNQKKNFLSSNINDTRSNSAENALDTLSQSQPVKLPDHQKNKFQIQL